MPHEQKEKEEITKTIWFLIVFGILGFVGSGIYVGLLIFQAKSSNFSPNEFGDTFGVINTVFSGLALAGVVVAIILQKQELALQREELKDTRQVLTEQKNQIAEQSETMQIQRFENTFFQMLSLHNEIVQGIALVNTLNPNQELLRGRSAIACIYDRLCNNIQRITDENFNLQLAEIVLTGYVETLSDEEDEFGHYLRNINNLLRLVDKENSNIDKKFYVEILEGQLNQSELGLILYRSFCKYDELHNNAVKYFLFDTLLPRTLVLPEHKESLFEYLDSNY